MITPFHPAVNVCIIHITLVEGKNIIILRRRGCYVVTEVDIVGTVPRAVRNTARSGNRPYDEHYGYINTSTPYPRQRWTRPSFPSNFSIQPLTFNLFPLTLNFIYSFFARFLLESK